MRQAQISPGDLQQAGEDAGGQQVLEAQALTKGVALLHQARHQQGGGAGGGGDHRRATAHDCQRHREQEGSEQAHPGVHAGDPGEGDRLWDHREGHHQPREDVAVRFVPPRLEEVAHVVSPVIGCSGCTKRGLSRAGPTVSLGEEAQPLRWTDRDVFKLSAPGWWPGLTASTALWAWAMPSVGAGVRRQAWMHSP